jgi:hypothetical protein
MKTVKKALVLMGAILLVFALTSGKGGGGGSSKGAKSTEGPQEITGLVWEWNAYSDAEANNGSSTIEKTEVDMDGQTAYRFAGAITSKYQYGFAGISIVPADENTLEQLKQATSFSFKVKGDGLRYAVKILTSDITDSCYYETRFAAGGDVATVTVPVSKLAQPTDWGIKKRFNQSSATEFGMQTTHNGKPGPFDLTVWDLKLYK